ncbi:VWA domain-containing protein [Marinicellulosiphila megalodicopiae]|uniref:VWA domain-containing protein n=1 Tax=Marinicellulosiphila megalodicopiae TaxID=2724896 RepID=UPI003BAFD0D4
MQNKTTLANRLESQFLEKIVDFNQLPSTLLPAVITNSIGELNQRTNAVSKIRQSLLTGNIENMLNTGWLPEPVMKNFQTQLTNTGLLEYCFDNEQIVDAVIIDMLNALEGLQPQYLSQKLVETKIAEKNQLENKSKQSDNTSEKTKNKKKKTIKLTEKELSIISEQASIKAWNKLSGTSNSLVSIQWSEKIEIWNEISLFFSDMKIITSIGWDLSRGFFQSHGWMNIVKLQEFIKNIPDLKKVIQSLGRAKISEESRLVQICETLIKIRLIDKPISSPFVPEEINGITRSGNIQRMLPQELMLLTNPTLKKLWHVKRAEEALVTYAVQGTEIEKIEVEEKIEEAGSKKQQKKLNQGPILICLDTSGSMQGNPESIAKAIVLQCLITCTKAKRHCYVYTFSGPGDVAEFELKFDKHNLDDLISFLCMSFSGGTDVVGPLNKALEKTKNKKWVNADLLLVSDGEFPNDSNLISKIRRYKKEKGLSVQGVIVGNNASAMKAVCDPLHHFDQWLDLIQEKSNEN